MRKVRIKRSLTHPKLFEFQKWARENGIPVVEVYDTTIGRTFMGTGFSLRLYGAAKCIAIPPPEFSCTLLIREQDADLVMLRI